MSRFILFFFISTITFGQTEQAWVFLSSKTFSPDVFESPTNFLSEKSVNRKNRHEITIDIRDLPIDQAKVNTIKNTSGISYITQSKWLNAVYVSGTETDINSLSNLAFVSEIFFMNRSLNTNTSAKKLTTAKTVKEDKFQEKSSFTYGNTTTQINQINLAPLHANNYTGEGLTIAVLDSGFENVDIISGFDRSRNQGNLLGGYDFPNRSSDIYAYKNSDHGTSVLSCMAGFIENQFVGTAPDAKYYLFRTEIAERESPEEEALWIAAAERADSLGVDILNTSLGYTEFDESKYNYTPSDMNGTTTFISQGTTIALEKGMIPVTSAGNTGSSTWRIVSAPADSEVALSIGAVNASNSQAFFSAFGPTSDGRTKPDVTALGQGSTVLNDQGTIVSSNGTSFSGPIIAGAVACLWQAFPNKKPLEIMDMVRSLGHLSNTPNNSLGFGVPNFGAALDSSLHNYDFTTETIIDRDLENTSVDDTLIINPNLIGKTVYIFNIQGKEVLKTTPTNTNIAVQTLQEGVYIFRHNSNNKTTTFIKK